MRAMVAEAIRVRTISHAHSKYRWGRVPQHTSPSGDVDAGVPEMAAIVASVCRGMAHMTSPELLLWYTVVRLSDSSQPGGTGW